MATRVPTEEADLARGLVAMHCHTCYGPVVRVCDHCKIGLCADFRGGAGFDYRRRCTMCARPWTWIAPGHHPLDGAEVM